MKRRRSSRSRQPESPRSSPCWGEFLDFEWYDRPEFYAAPRDAWKSSRPDAILIQRVLVEMLAQPDRLSRIRLREPEQVASLTGDLDRRGFDEPLVVVVDQKGRIMLKDGHHRLLAAIALDLDHVPVRFRRSERVAALGGASAQEMIPLLLGAR